MIAALVLGAGVAAAQGWDAPTDPPTGAAAEPARGTPARSDLLDHLRPVIAYHLGAPLEFRVVHLRSDGARAFAMLVAQRPGGQRIAIEATPMVQRDGEPPSLIDGSLGAGPAVQAFLVRRGGQWQVLSYAVGATDAWWVGEPWCKTYGFAPVMPDDACRENP